MTFDRDSRAELLLAASEKPVNRFLQLDGFPDMKGDCGLNGDDDGDAINSVMVDELRNGCPVRIQIALGTPKADAVRLLKKLRKSLKTWPSRNGIIVEADYTAAVPDKPPF